jgi:hypothetical protein
MTNAEVPFNSGQMQVESQKCNVSAKYLKFVIHSGYDEFAAVMEIKINANGKWIC